MDLSFIGKATLWDWFIVIVFLISTLSAYWRGFVRLAFGLAGWGVALIFTVPVTAVVLSLLRDLAVSADSTPPTIVMQVLIFIVLLVLTRLAGFWVRKLLIGLRLGAVDRFLGALLGMARAVLIIAVAAMLGLRFGMATEPAWQNAYSVDLLNQLAISGFQLLDEYNIKPPELSAFQSR